MADTKYVTCTTRRNKPVVNIDICRVCKKRVGCKDYLKYLENLLFPGELSKSVSKRLEEQAKEPEPVKKTGVKVFKWKE